MRVVGVQDELRVGQRGRRLAPAGGERARARRNGRAGRGRGSRAAAPSAGRAAPPRAEPPRRPRTGRARRRGSASRAEATPETRLAPALLWATRTRGRRISAAIAVVVVLPFVAETSTEPCGSRAARASISPGSSFHASLPGRVVPPPRPASREARRRRVSAAISSERGGADARAHRIRPRLGCYLQIFQSALPLLVMAESDQSRVTVPSRRSIRRHSPTFRRACASATPTSRSSPSCAPPRAGSGARPP